MRFLRLILLGLSLFVIAGCAKDVAAPDNLIAERAYQHPGPPSVTLLTMISNETGNGGHSSLMINTPGQRIMYDPAGRYKTDRVAERGDVLYGVSDVVLAQYNSFHARTTHHVLIQEVTVSPEVAQQAMRLAQQQGASHDAMCAANVSAVINQIPGFQSVRPTWSPKGLSRQFGQLPNVKTDAHYETDVGQNYTPPAAAE